jgi:phage-related protein
LNGLAPHAATSVSFGLRRSRILVTSYFEVQLGLMPNNYKPMPDIGAGTYEIRVSDPDGIARLMYVAKFRETVYVLHVFEKKTQRTPQKDIEEAKRRYKEAQAG